MLINEIYHISQPDGISCGPTCIAMLANFFGIDKEDHIQELCLICGTNPHTGTTDVHMERGLKYLGVTYRKPKQNTIEYLKHSLDNGNLLILRTLIYGIKHWIIVYGHNEKGFLVNDPAFGQKIYNDEFVHSIWKARDYFFFEIPRNQKLEKKENLKIVPIDKTNRNEVLEMCTEAFGSHFDGSVSEYLNANVDWDISIALKLNDKVIGCYLFNEMQLPNPPKKYQGLDGVHGVALVIKPEYRSKGYGEILKDYPKRHWDYIWGMQLHSLGNLEHWLKRRELISNENGLYITAEIF